MVILGSINMRPWKEMALSVEAYYFFYQQLPEADLPPPGPSNKRHLRDTKHVKKQINLDWWSARVVLKRFPFVDEGDGFFRDFAWDVSKEFFLEIAEDQLKTLRKKTPANPQKEKLQTKRREEINDFLRDFPKESLLRIRVFEWESGLE